MLAKQLKYFDLYFIFIGRNFLSAKWFGFTDAQSEIDYFVIRVGTARGSGDIYPPRIITAHDMVLLTDLPEPLHLNRRIYTTIRAYNKAGKKNVTYNHI